ncbi:MAG: hypothetical protein ABSE62_00425 [Chthoniobacteraceae bacterium]
MTATRFSTLGEPSYSAVLAGFGAKNIEDLKIIPFSFMGLTGCLFEVDNRSLISGSGAPLILTGTTPR